MAMTCEISIRACVRTFGLILVVALVMEDSHQAGANDNESSFESLFDGETFDHWDGDKDIFRIEDGSIVGGTLRNRIPHNFFLRYNCSYSNFELRLEFKLVGESTNAGIQLRSKRIRDHHEMVGYQADLGQTYWGCLYDESRRRKVLAGPDQKQIAGVLKQNDWNDYRIVCNGPRIRLWINGVLTADYTEADTDIPLDGDIALQIHGGAPGEVWYRNIRIRKT